MTFPRFCYRATELTPAQRQAIDNAREALRGHFPGETMRIYVPRTDAASMAEQRRRIMRAIDARESAASIAKREGVSERFVRKLRGLIGTLPP